MQIIEQDNMDVKLNMVKSISFSRYLLILLCIISFTNCSSENYVKELSSIEQFKDFSGPPLTDKYHEIKAVKVVYDLAKQQLFYLNYSTYRLHFDFCNSLSPYPLDAYTFNQLNYSENPDRAYLLGNINYDARNNRFFLELSPTDKMSLNHITLLYDAVLNSSFIDSSLSFLLNNTIHLANKNLIGSLPTSHPKEIYDGLKYQPIHKASTIGRLRWARTVDLKNMSFKTSDILVLNQTPVFLPPVGGVIVTEFQTPLSHLTILGQNRKIPICATLDTARLNQLKSLQDSNIKFTVLSDDYTIVKTEKEVQVRKLYPKLKLKADLEFNEILDLTQVRNKSRDAIGNKAANLAMLQKLAAKRTFKTPENAFVIPFYFYQQHIASSNTKQLIDSLLSGEFDRDKTISLLRKIRKRIKNHPLDDHLLTEVNRKIKRDSNFTAIRFRSSTNAEDAVGFSGAGLYESETGKLNHPKKTVERAMKKVWASLWSAIAYQERELFDLDQSTVYMGILVHRSFPDEELNGVAITKNLYRPENEGYVVNVQLGENSVVKPDSGETVDQFICYPKQSIYAEKNSNQVIDIITTSSLGDGNLLMKDTEISNLANELYAIKRFFSSRTLLSSSNIDAGFDVEFKLYGAQRDLYIKQVRLYNH